MYIRLYCEFFTSPLQLHAGAGYYIYDIEKNKHTDCFRDTIIHV
jgi:hypothetical protein